MFIQHIFHLLLLKIIANHGKTYKGYKVYNIKAGNRTQIELIFVMAKNINYDFFLLPSYMIKTAEVLIAPENQKDFEATLLSHSLNFTIINNDVEKSWELKPNKARPAAQLIDEPFNRFLTYDEINTYLENLAKKYPQRTKIRKVGKSYENRDIKTITITNGQKNNFNKSIIVVEAGLHAREWMSIAAALFFIYQLVVEYESNESLFNYDWIVLPLANPDGYIYTHTTDRLWRKTRQPSVNNCIGTDGNRNFDYLWGYLEGSSDNPCHFTYRGPHAFSEPETRIIRDLILSNKNHIQIYLSLHSYGSFILHPWGFTSEMPKNLLDLEDICREGAAAIRIYSGRKYGIGSAAWKDTTTTGSSLDYTYGKARIPFCFSFVLRDDGKYAYHPPVSKIKPLVKDAWIGTKVMVMKIMNEFDIRSGSKPRGGYLSWPLIVLISVMKIINLIIT